MFYLEITDQDGETQRIALPSGAGDITTMKIIVRGRVMRGAERAAVIFDIDGESETLAEWSRTAEEIQEKRRQYEMEAWEHYIQLTRSRMEATGKF